METPCGGLQRDSLVPAEDGHCRGAALLLLGRPRAGPGASVGERADLLCQACFKAEVLRGNKKKRLPRLVLSYERRRNVRWCLLWVTARGARTFCQRYPVISLLSRQPTQGAGLLTPRSVCAWCSRTSMEVEVQEVGGKFLQFLRPPPPPRKPPDPPARHARGARLSF